MNGAAPTGRLTQVSAPRFNDPRNCITAVTEVLLLTVMLVLRLRASGVPTLIIGTARLLSIRPPVLLKLNDVLTIVLMPWPFGRPRKNVLKLLRAYMTQGMTLHLVPDTILQTFLKVRVPN